ncbi:uncharacterized protein LOC141617231 [Silene latifolia]|uniref:uncharacterized protein LOC141617231 n=1 Tax=Silene latifolia TaxID=37657 RepID=UPI003D7747F0
MQVAELVEENRQGWNLENRGALFFPFEQECIIKMSICDHPLTDGWCWEGERDDIYSVTSAYRLLLEKDGEEEGSSSVVNDSWLWNEIWNLPVLPQIKVFFWQLCSEAIATRSNILVCVPLIGDECPRCGDCVESCFHVVRGYGWVRGVWAGLELDVLTIHGFQRVREWVEANMRVMGVRECVEFMTGCWAIWERRNKAIFEDAELRADLVVQRVRELLWEMRSSGVMCS